MRHFIFPLLLALVVASLAGCGFSNQFIFSSSTELIARPDQYGLTYKEVTFPSENGIALHGWMVPGTPGKPLVLFFHGNTANISHRIENLQYLNNLGLSVFIFDYRGFGISEGTPYGESSLYLDAREALSYVRSKGWTTPQLIYYGRSMGAAVALQLAIEAPPNRVILESSFTSLHDIAWEMTPITYALFGWWTMENQFRNSEKISRLKTPVLLIHGDHDRIVPMSMSQELYAHAPQPKRLLIVPGAEHSNAFKVGGQAYRKAWLDFIDSGFPRQARVKGKRGGTEFPP
jgi:pimeloyl-ACP methyl ester carboxylesterase